MDEKRLPNLQILTSLFFSLAALLAPFFLTRGSLVMGILILLGLLLGILTLAVGYRAVVQKRPVQYPFAGWSRWLLSRLTREPAPPARARAAQRQPSPQGNLQTLGLLNLVLGGLLVLGMLYAALSLLL